MHWPIGVPLEGAEGARPMRTSMHMAQFGQQRSAGIEADFAPNRMSAPALSVVGKHRRTGNPPRGFTISTEEK
jgi:hypothetical protein